VVTSARYLGWFIALIGALMAVMTGSYLLFGAPEFTFNGEPVDSPAQASRALAAAVCVLGVGAALAAVLQTKVLDRFPVIQPYVRWLEALPTDDPREHKRLYIGVASLGIPLIALAATPELGPRILLVAALPILCVLGWGMVWLVLGFQLINPVAYLVPWFLTFAARLFHFLFLLGASLSIVYLPFSHAQQAEIGMSAPVGAGAAFGASQFLRFWSSRK
jgi:hypothetical protein